MATSQKPPLTAQYRFGPFEVETRTGELYKSGASVRLQAQPFRVLCTLIEHAGEVVSREELQRQIWGAGTTGDLDHGLDVAINTLRDVLEDAADAPQYIETLARRGYRFIGALTAEPATSNTDPELAPATAAFTAPTSLPAQRIPRTIWLVGAGVTVALLLALLPLFRITSSSNRLPRIREITDSGHVYPGFPLQESLAQTATDGSRLFFTQIENGHAVLSQASIGDGEISLLPISSPILFPTIQDISPDGAEILVRNQSRETEGPLWIVPSVGGRTQQIPDVEAHDATWMPDGRKILFANGADLLVADEHGGEIHKVASVPGRAFWLRWSPDGKLLRFTLINTLDHITSLWEMTADGKTVRPFLAGWSQPASECCGSWTGDGQYFVFQSGHSGQNNIWALEESTGFRSLLPHPPFQLTNGPLSYQSPIAMRSGHQVSFLGLNTRSELLRYDPVAQLFLPNNDALNSAQFVRYSRDGQWVAWISRRGSTLWRSRTNGSQRLQLTAASMEVYMMEWSADNQHLVLMGREPGKLWRLYETDADGGNLHPLLEEARNEADPSWTPDSNTIVFGRPPDVMAERSQNKAIYLLDLKTGQPSSVPRSDGLFSPRCSPDGRYIAALPLGQRSLMLFDRTSGTWKTLASQPAADPIWSHDGHWIYFHDFQDKSQPIYRASAPEGRVERVASLSNLQSIDVADFRFVGLAPGDLPLIRARISTANIYSASLDDAPGR